MRRITVSNILIIILILLALAWGWEASKSPAVTALVNGNYRCIYDNECCECGCQCQTHVLDCQ